MITMGEFIEPEGIDQEDIKIPKPRVFTNEFISDAVRKSINTGDMPLDHKLAFFGIVDERGARAIISVQVLDKEIFEAHKLNVKVQGVVEHEWTGNDRAGAQFLFSVK